MPGRSIGGRERRSWSATPRCGPIRRRISARACRRCGCCGRASASCGRRRLARPCSGSRCRVRTVRGSGGSCREGTRSTIAWPGAAHVCSRRSGGGRARWWHAAAPSWTFVRCRSAPASTFRRARRALSSRSVRWTRRWCSIRRRGAGAASVLAVALTGCVYGFKGGGLPNIKTVAILPFDNQTAEPALTKEVNDAVLEAFQGRLGLRTAGENNADAVVRGKVTRYDPDVPLSFQAGQGRTDVTQRQVSITVDVEIVDQREGKTLWQRQGLSEVGEYPPRQEADGRKLALQQLVRDLEAGPQPHW